MSSLNAIGSIDAGIAKNDAGSFVIPIGMPTAAVMTMLRRMPPGTFRAMKTLVTQSPMSPRTAFGS